MNTWRILRLVAVIVALMALAVPTIATTVSLDSDKLDKVTMKDGRVFTGEIISEDDNVLTMKVSFKGISTEQTWSKADIIEIVHDVVDSAGSGTKVTGSSGKSNSKANTPSNPNARQVYVLPFRGVIGFDAYDTIIQKLWDEAVEAGADTIILEYDADDGSSDLEAYRDFIEDLKRDAQKQEIELVVWMKGALGVSVAYALMFENIYFYPGAVMGGGESLDTRLKENFSDEYVRAKMISAWVGICRGMAEEGGYDAELCEAMIRPEKLLSVTFEGRTPVFHADTDSGRPVDTSDEATIWLDSEEAHQYGISKDVCRTVDDLMYKLHRNAEYEIIEGKAEALTEKWIEGWRYAAEEEYPALLQEIADAGNYDEEPERILGRQLNIYKKIKRLVQKWPPIAKAPYGPVDVFGLDVQIDNIRKQIQDINERKREDR